MPYVVGSIVPWYSLQCPSIRYATLYSSFPSPVLTMISTLSAFRLLTQTSSWAYIYQLVGHEMDVTVRLLSSNATGFGFIFLSALLARQLRTPLSIIDFLNMTAKTFALGIASAYIFDIANQASSPEEDRINKPHRPIPAGIISVREAKLRWAISWSLGLICTYIVMDKWAMVHMLHWQALIFFMYAFPARQTWYLRSYFAAAGYLILVRLFNSMVIGSKKRWDVSLSTEMWIFVWFMSTVHIQEFHDTVGDWRAGRKTLPILLSSGQLKVLRAFTSFFFVVFGILLLISANKPRSTCVVNYLLVILQQSLSCVMAYRVYYSKSPKMDKTTYRIYYYALGFFYSTGIGLIQA